MDGRAAQRRQPCSGSCSRFVVLSVLAGLLVRRRHAAGGRRARGWPPGAGSTASTPCPPSSPVPPLAQRSRILAADGCADRDLLRREPDLVPLSEVAQIMQKAISRDRGLAVLRARRHRPARHHPRAGQQRPGRRRPGRVDPDPAVRQAGLQENAADSKDDKERPRRPPPHRPTPASCGSCATRSRSRRSTPRSRSSSATSTSPTSATGPTASRPPPALLQHPRRQAHPPAGRPARRHRPAADGVRPVRNPKRAAGPAQHRARPDGEVGLVTPRHVDAAKKRHRSS